MSLRRLYCLSALGALTGLFGCQEQAGPDGPGLPGTPTLTPGAAPGALSDAGNPASDAGNPGLDAANLVFDAALPADFAALPRARVEPSDLLPYTPPAPVLPFTLVHKATRPLPAISGGTMAVAADGTVVASDPDRDQIYVLDAALKDVSTLQLAAGEEPGRVAVHGERAFVALRAAGTLLIVDLKRRSVSARLPVCAAPRGVYFDTVDERVLVACAGGELVAVSADGARVLRRAQLVPDLRDVGRDAEGLWVSQFRSATLLRLDAELRSTTRQQPVTIFNGSGPKPFTPTLAWRTIAGRSGEVYMLHQRAQSSPVGGAPSASGSPNFGYGNATTPSDPPFCESGIVHSAVTHFVASQIATQPALPQAVLPVDLSVAPAGRMLAAVAPGNFERQGAPGPTGLPAAQQLYLIDTVINTALGSCLSAAQGWQHQFPGEAIAVQFVDDATLLVQVRNPAELHVLRFDEPDSPRLSNVIALSPLVLRDTGHEVFHQNTGKAIACASCHGEALDDGHVWNFAGVGGRRTQHLRGGVLETAPFHWSGDLGTFDALLNDVYQMRMGGPGLSGDARAALFQWLAKLPRIPNEPGDAARVARGRALFASPEVGCASCHAGTSLRSDGRHDVGTGGSFEVPSLHALPLRLPLMHNGCADTLEKRFDPSCGGASHGSTAQLGPEQLADLIAYLASL